MERQVKSELKLREWFKQAGWEGSIDAFRNPKDGKHTCFPLSLFQYCGTKIEIEEGVAGLGGFDYRDISSGASKCILWLEEWLEPIIVTPRPSIWSNNNIPGRFDFKNMAKEPLKYPETVSDKSLEEEYDDLECVFEKLQCENNELKSQIKERDEGSIELAIKKAIESMTIQQILEIGQNQGVKIEVTSTKATEAKLVAVKKQRDEARREWACLEKKIEQLKDCIGSLEVQFKTITETFNG